MPRRAIEIDPDFGLAYAARGMSHLVRAMVVEGLQRSPSALLREIRLAIADGDRALEIDPDIGLAHIVSAARYLLPGADAASIEPAVDRAIALSPNDGTVLFLAAGWYLSELRTAEARVLLERVLQLDPNADLHERTRGIGDFLFLAGDLAGAAEMSRLQVEEDPTSTVFRHQIAFLEALRGNADEAMAQLVIAEELLADLPEGDVYRFGYMPVYAYSRMGHPDAARRMFDRFVAPVPEDKLLPMMWVLAYLGIGDVDRAYEWAAAITDLPRMPWPGWELWFVINPMNDPVLDTPRFLELRRKLGYRG